MNKSLSRREFLQVSSAAAIAGAVAFSTEPSMGARATQRKPFRGTLCLFSKPVPQLNWSELGQYAKQAGFGGIDLTVRTDGHVLPERVTVDLPKAVAAIRAAGLEVPMISTELVTADHPTAEPILKTARQLSIPYIKPGYYHYKLINVIEERNEAGRKFRGLVELAEKHEIQVGYHNHTDYVGESIWDMESIMEPLNPRWSGYYFDFGHAVVDNGENGWKIGTNLVIPRLKMVAVKDFVWKQIGPHKWHADTCPVGEGIAPYREFLQILSQSNFHGPISLQQEFPVPGIADYQGIAVSRATAPQVMSVAKENLDTLKSLMREFYEDV